MSTPAVGPRNSQIVIPIQSPTESHSAHNKDWIGAAIGGVAGAARWGLFPILA